MSRAETYEQKAEELILPITDAHGFELVDIEYVKEAGNWYLRAYIDKEGGITVDDCELVSRAFEAELDREDFIEGAYILEVSSPGLGRQLKKEKDYLRALGKKVEIHTFRTVNRQKSFVGILEQYDKDGVTIKTEDGEELQIEKNNLALIRMAIDF